VRAYHVRVMQDASPRDDNRARVLDALRRHGCVSRRELVDVTGLSRSTVSSLVGEMQDLGHVVEKAHDEQPSGRGRPATRLRFAASAGVLLAVDFDHHQISVAVGDLSGGLLAEKSTSRVDQAVDAPTIATDLVAAAAAAAGAEASAPVATVVSLPGPVRMRDAEIAGSPLLPSWIGAGTAADLRRRFGGDVRFENDANLAAYAEHCYGAGRDADDMVYVVADDGIGAGLVLNGRPYAGAWGLAGELGHVRVVPNGPLCRCGNRGCLGTVAGAGPLLELLRTMRGDDLTVRGMIELAAGGDEAARRLVRDAGFAIGQVLAALCNHVNPARIVVGGALSDPEAPLLDGIAAGIEQDALPGTAELVDVVRGQLGPRATLLGALALAARDTDRLPSARLSVAVPP